jgi:hypothetical protein
MLVAMRVVRYQTPREEIEYAEHVMHWSLNASFELILRRSGCGQLQPLERATLLRAAQQRRHLGKLVANLRRALLN